VQIILSKLCLILGIAALVVSVWLAGTYDGFMFGGSRLCEYSYPAYDGFWISDSNPYIHARNSLVYVNWSLITYIILCLFDRWKWIRLLGFAPLAVGIAAFFGASRVVDSSLSDTDKYIDLFRVTSEYASALPVLLFGLSAVHVLSLFIGRRRTAENRPSQE
jgi:hypothetical protein